MSRQSLFLVVVLLVVAVFVTSGTATEPVDDGITRELADMNRSLASIADTVDRLHNVTLLLRRMEMKGRRVLATESALRGARNQLQNMEADIASVETYAESVTESIRELIQEGAVGPETDDALSQMRREESELLRMIETNRSQIADQELRVRELEDELEDLEDDVDDLEKLLEALGES